MSNVKMGSMLMNHELLKAMVVRGHSEPSTMKCRISGAPFSSLEVAQGEALAAILKKPESSRRLNVLVIHDMDLDGTVSFVTLEHFLTALGYVDIVSLARTSGSPFRAITPEDVAGQYDIVFVLDQAFNQEVFKLLQKTYAKLVWIDHHPVVDSDDVEVNPDAELFYIDQSYSTANLVYRMTTASEMVTYSDAFQHTLNSLCYLTHFHDTWQYTNNDEALSESRHHFLSRDAKGLSTWFYTETNPQAVLRALLGNETAENMKLGALYDCINHGIQVGEVRKTIRQRVFKYVNKVNWDLDGQVYNVAYMFHSDDMSDLGHDLLNQEDELDAVMVVFGVADKHVMRFSVRGREDRPAINLLCQRLGGGGHRNAAGFEVPVADVAKYLQDLVLPPKEMKDE